MQTGQVNQFRPDRTTFAWSALLKGVLPRQIVRRRLYVGLTSKALARLARVSASTLSDIEGGQIPDVKISTLGRLAESLGTSVGELLGCDRPPQLRECGHAVTDGHPHGLGECVLLRAEAGQTIMQIALLLGLAATSVEQIIEDEHEMRRRRRC